MAKTKRKPMDLVGQRFGRLTVLEEATPIQYPSQPRTKTRRLLVRCDCGGEKVVRMDSVRSGASVSCGCTAKDWCRTHGMEATKVYGVWASMKARCNNPKHRAYKNYGGRGISVCGRWQKFENFYADMGEPTGVLDRIDPDGNYTMANCRWVTWSVSNKNQRRHLNKN